MICPNCKSDLSGDPIPEHLREMYGNATHFERVISRYDAQLDKTVGWKCPDCKHEWPR